MWRKKFTSLWTTFHQRCIFYFIFLSFYLPHSTNKCTDDKSMACVCSSYTILSNLRCIAPISKHSTLSFIYNYFSANEEDEWFSIVISQISNCVWNETMYKCIFILVNSYNLMQSYKGPFLFDLVLVYEKFGEYSFWYIDIISCCKKIYILHTNISDAGRQIN